MLTFEFQFHSSFTYNTNWDIDDLFLKKLVLMGESTGEDTRETKLTLIGLSIIGGKPIPTKDVQMVATRKSTSFLPL